MLPTVADLIMESIDRTEHDYAREASFLEKIVDTVRTFGSQVSNVYLSDDLYIRYVRERIPVEGANILRRLHPRACMPITIELANDHWCAYDTGRLAEEVVKRKEETRELPLYSKAV